MIKSRCAFDKKTELIGDCFIILLRKDVDCWKTYIKNDVIEQSEAIQKKELYPSKCTTGNKNAFIELGL